MATQYQNLSEYDPEALPSKLRLSKQQYAIVVADWNSEITHSLMNAAISTFEKNGVKPNNIKVIHVPGTFELTFAAKELAKDYLCEIENRKVMRYSAVIVIGCVIQGDTPHFDYVCAEASKGVAHVGLETGVPVAFGVLTTENIEQAVERAGTKAGNKGVDAAMTAIEMVNLLKNI